MKIVEHMVVTKNLREVKCNLFVLAAKIWIHKQINKRLT